MELLGDDRGRAAGAGGTVQPRHSFRGQARRRGGGRCQKQLVQPLGVLDGALGRSANLLGDNFTVADLNVASILSWARPAQIDMSPFPKTGEWLKNCAERPAARAARRLQRE